MIHSDSIHRRGQALENEYFQRVDQALLSRLRENSDRPERLRQLQETAGVTDIEVANHLLDAGIDASNLAALALTPIVFVAWASGSVSNEERQGVISSALRRGVASNPVAFQLLEQWLQNRPSRELWSLWKEYATLVNKSLPAETAEKLRARLIAQAREVAMASGGVFGVGKICPAEQRVLDEIEAALTGTSES